MSVADIIQELEEVRGGQYYVGQVGSFLVFENPHAGNKRISLGSFTLSSDLGEDITSLLSVVAWRLQVFVHSGKDRSLGSWEIQLEVESRMGKQGFIECNL